MTQHHGTPLGTRVGQGVSVALAATAVWFMVQAHSVTGLSVTQVALLLLAVALTGGLAGAGYYATDALRSRAGWRGAVATGVTWLACAALAFVLVRLLY